MERNYEGKGQPDPVHRQRDRTDPGVAAVPGHDQRDRQRPLGNAPPHRLGDTVERRVRLHASRMDSVSSEQRKEASC